MKSQIHEHPKNNIKRVSKKLLFSAVALVAFSSISMGNTIAVEEKKEVEVKVDSTCHYLSFLTYNSSREAGYSVAQSQALANNMFYKCMAGKLPRTVSLN